MSHSTDKIIIKGMQFYGYHGLFKEETKLGQLFIVDLEMNVDVEKPGRSGQMEDSVHYGEVFDCIRHLVEGEHVQLIEELAINIADELFAQFELIEGLKIRVKKPQAPVPGIFSYVAAEIERERPQTDGEA